MINSTSYQYFFPSNSQNYNPNILPSSSKMLNYNFSGYQTLNSLYTKSNNNKKINEIELTDENADLNNMPKLIIDNSQTNKDIYNNPIYSNMNKKVDLNLDYIGKISLSAKRNHNSSQNLNFQNYPDSGMNKVDKNDYTIYKIKISDELVDKRNMFFTPRVDKARKDYKIPHPTKKKLTDIFKQIPNKYNNNAYNSQYNLNQGDSNSYNHAISNSNNSIDNLTNILNSSVDNLTVNNLNLDDEPKDNFKLSDFTILNEIGKGAEGTIYAVRWNKNNKKYALKKILVTLPESIKKRKEDNSVIKKFIETTGCNSIIKPIANLTIKNDAGFYDLYEILELAENDWEKEILKRSETKKYYSESELMNIFHNLINTFSLLQDHHITHRDIKPQNILLKNGRFKICDFGNARILKRQGVIIQRIRGSELFMSPIVYEGHRSGKQNIRHNAYKSDVFSLGMCLFLAASLSYDGPNIIRLIYDMKAIKKVLKYNLAKRYSENLINLLWTMLQVEEKKRPDFSELKALYP